MNDGIANDTNFFSIHILGHELEIRSAFPDRTAECLRAVYGSGYSEYSSRPENSDFRLELLKSNDFGERLAQTGAAVLQELKRDSNTAPPQLAISVKALLAAPAAGSDENDTGFIFSGLAAAVQHMLQTTECIYSLHAAAVSWRNSGIVFAGANGAGKSTLARSMVLNGAEYLSDDSTFIKSDRKTTTILPNPEVISAPGVPVEDMDKLIAQGFSAGPDPRFMMPPSKRRPAPLATIIFPEWSEEEPGLYSLTNRETLLKILKLIKT
ncbi:MAG TPA: hypothetical protein PLQ76_09985, partial [bacterium]|nr:hypothetical protein [bacterium]